MVSQILPSRFRVTSYNVLGSAHAFPMLIGGLSPEITVPLLTSPEITFTHPPTPPTIPISPPSEVNSPLTSLKNTIFGGRLRRGLNHHYKSIYRAYLPRRAKIFGICWFPRLFRLFSRFSGASLCISCRIWTFPLKSPSTFGFP